MPLFGSGERTVNHIGSAVENVFQNQLDMIPVQEDDGVNEIILVAFMLDYMLDGKPTGALISYRVSNIAVLADIQAGDILPIGKDRLETERLPCAAG
jgi:hypothetical protein